MPTRRPKCYKEKVCSLINFKKSILILAKKHTKKNKFLKEYMSQYKKKHKRNKCFKEYMSRYKKNAQKLMKKG